MWVAGADGCRAGWVRAARETASGALDVRVVADAADLLTVPPRPAVLAIDIPIGLPEMGVRNCDRLARERLGWPRRTSVFPAPIRPAVQAGTRMEASRITADRDGREVGVQAWALYAKIRQVDELLRADPVARRTVREVHPELCFWAWAGGRPMGRSKKTRAGRAQRLRLVEAWLGADVLARARGRYRKTDVGDDDILDAIAALWTADRLARGAAVTMPEDPPLDATGLRMEIVY